MVNWRFSMPVSKDVLAFYTFPKPDARKISSSNMIERLNREICRRKSAVEIFPGSGSDWLCPSLCPGGAYNLAISVLMDCNRHQNDSIFKLSLGHLWVTSPEVVVGLRL